ncbi:hypothetical protein RM549_17585 [Salegentibacter sp. F188]|uniref:Uncharacterized protein n=1 Tax=Autumnicola patrickiae TaxID=3075591 RepID=A0ABU3E6I7_9FLAO|nr:hypothetical protein [Salegentibacter sp. F188]MDT0691608.1 hypothetical protein [Salegentibacter sp. F188]
MAEINAKKKNPKWLWIILAALILGIVLLVFLFQDGNVDERNDEREEIEEVSMTPDVLLQPSNLLLIQALHAPFRIKIEALV